MNKQILLLLLLSVLGAQELWHQGISTPGEHLYSIYSTLEFNVSIASHKEENISVAPGIITLYTRSDLERNQWKNLEEVLMATPGFFSHPVWSLHKVAVSGRGNTRFIGNKVLFLLNGRPFRQQGNGTGYADMLYGLPVEMIEQVEIIRGPGSVLYGSGAYDGVVSVITRNEFPEHSQALYGAGSSLKTSAGDASKDNAIFEAFAFSGWQNQAANATLHLSAAYKKERGEEHHGIMAGTLETARQHWESRIIMLNSSLHNWSFDALISHSQTIASSLLPPINHKEGLRTFANLGHQWQNTLWTTKTNLTWNSNFLQSNSTVVPPLVGVFDFTALEPHLPAFGAESLATVHDFPANIITANGKNMAVLGEFTLLFNPLHNWNLLTGIAAEKAYGKETSTPVNMDYSGVQPFVPILQAMGLTQASTNLQQGLAMLPPKGMTIYEIPYYEYTTYNIYGQTDFRPIAQLKLIAGIQLNKRGKNSDLTPRIGAIWNFSDYLGIKLNRASAYRAPSPLETDMVHVIIKQNPKSLHPERVVTTDAEIFGNIHNVVFSASIWHSAHSNHIHIKNLDSLKTGVTSLMFVNANEAPSEFYGYDLTARIKLNNHALWDLSFSDYHLRKNANTSYAPKQVLQSRKHLQVHPQLRLSLNYTHYAPSEEDRRIINGVGLTAAEDPATIKKFRRYKHSHLLGFNSVWQPFSSDHKQNTLRINVGMQNILNQAGYVDGGAGFFLPNTPGRTFFTEVFAEF
jgi:outer membrane receptor for ferrienterochelin and colicins